MLQVTARANEMTISVDQQVLLTVQDDTYPQGSVGIRVQAVYAEAEFDYVIGCE